MTNDTATDTTTADRAIHLPVAAQPSIDHLVEYSQLAEQRGYTRAWLPETWGRDAVTVLTAIAERTETIGIGPSILNVYSRSPALIGQTAATLQEVSDGRLRLGLGPSGPIFIQGWHGVDFDRPLRRTREYVEIVRNVVSGEELDYDGDIFNLAGFRLRCDPPETPPRIDVAGMGPKSVELAGRFADGWHALLFTPEGLAERLDDLRRGAELGDRDSDDVRVSVSLNCCALADGERARTLGRQHAAFYIGAMGTFYRDALARQGYEEEAMEIATAYANGDQDAALDALHDELFDDLAACGTPEHAREQVEKFAAVEGVDEIAVGLPRGATPAEIEATIDALAPET